jgi:hypothetical protein
VAFLKIRLRIYSNALEFCGLYLMKHSPSGIMLNDSRSDGQMFYCFNLTSFFLSPPTSHRSPVDLSSKCVKSELVMG